MNTVIEFKAAVRHDHGTTRFITSASNKKQVKEIIVAAEPCPERAIRKVEPLNLKGTIREMLRAQIKEAQTRLDEFETIRNFLAPYHGKPTDSLEKKLPQGMKLTADSDYIIIEIVPTGHRHHIARRKDPRVLLDQFETINGPNTHGPRDTITKASALLKDPKKIARQAKLISQLSNLCDEFINVCAEMKSEGLTQGHPTYYALLRLLSLPSNVIRDIVHP